ncbi:MAG TPA: L-erythro-3,5-diaminohexanoate dehydrogenase, partial [Myxococcaceae bacterium]|nr:L-erythro-3,5-diaminohexanoate dehydrogenase [Myxococcaceae bacterium]
IASLVSLTLTPLALEEIKAVHPALHRLDVRGHALLFATCAYAKLPDDLPDTLVLPALDVCGAPALVDRWARPGMSIAVLGAGKSGILCLAQARRLLKGQGLLVAIDISEQSLAMLESAGLCDVALQVDATQALATMEAVSRATSGGLCELGINCTSRGNTEMATILSVKDGGMALFFSMATSFTAAALGADGVGKDVTLLMGNGYVPGHAELTLELLRSEPALRQLFEARFA